MFARVVGVLLTLALVSGGALSRTCPDGWCALASAIQPVDCGESGADCGAVASAHLDAAGSCAGGTQWSRQVPARGARVASTQVILAAAWHTPPAALVPLPARLPNTAADAAGSAPARGTLIAQFTSLLL